MDRHQNLFLDAFQFPYGQYGPGYLCNKTYSNIGIVQRLELERKLSVHNGCVNTITWSDGGQYLLSGSDDQKLVISNPFKGKVIFSVQTGHRANIFSAKFMPNTRDKRVVSCSGDGLIYLTDLDRPEELHGFDCHFGTTYEVLTIPQDPHSFLSCGEDGTVRWFDLRIKDTCTKEDCKEDVLINCRRAVTAINTNPVAPYELAVGCSDSSIRIYDRRMLGTKATGNYTGRGVMGMRSRFSAPGLENSHHRITSLSYSHDGTELLASYSSEHLYLFNLKENGRLKEFGADMKDGGSCLKKSSKQPPIKRLRLRGDWSDTGPNARPERERDNEGNDQAAATIMQRMSDMLTRWLEGATRRGEEHETPPDRPSPEALANRSSEGEAAAANQTERAELSSSSVEMSGTVTDSDSILGGPLPCIGDRSGSVDNASRSVTVCDTREGVCDSEETIQSGATEKVECGEAEESLQQDATSSATASGRSELPPSFTTSDSYSAAPQLSEAQSVSMTTETPSESIVSEALGGSIVSEALGGSVVEPLVSLQYRSLGTCASTITLDCRVRHNVDCTEYATSSSELSSPPPPPPKDSVTTEGALGDGDVSTSDLESELSSLDRTRDCDNDMEEGLSTDLESPTQDTQSVTLQSNEGYDLAEDSVQSCTAENTTQSCNTVEDTVQDSAQASTFENSADSISEGPSETRTDITVTVQSEQGVEDLAATSGQAPEQSTDVEPMSGESNPEEAGACLPGPSGVRQRRIGVSGTPTGTSPGDEEEEDHEDTDDDSDAERSRASRRSRLGRWVVGDETAERHAAAIRLQELYRRRQETREREELEMMQLPQPTLQCEYRGHRNARTMIKEASFWGRDFVMSGSDCGHVFIWDRYTAELVMLLEGDKHVVNCVQPHPFYPVLATSGIDYDVKLWTPKAVAPNFDAEKAQEILRRNEVMLEETKDTITVPASFMLRMLASLNHFRSARRGAGVDGESSPSSEENDD